MVDVVLNPLAASARIPPIQEGGEKSLRLPLDIDLPADDGSIVDVVSGTLGNGIGGASGDAITAANDTPIVHDVHQQEGHTREESDNVRPGSSSGGPGESAQQEGQTRGGSIDESLEGSASSVDRGPVISEAHPAAMEAYTPAMVDPVWAEAKATFRNSLEECSEHRPRRMELQTAMDQEQAADNELELISKRKGLFYLSPERTVVKFPDAHHLCLESRVDFKTEPGGVTLKHNPQEPLGGVGGVPEEQQRQPLIVDTRGLVRGQLWEGSHGKAAYGCGESPVNGKRQPRVRMDCRPYRDRDNPRCRAIRFRRLRL